MVIPAFPELQKTRASLCEDSDPSLGPHLPSVYSSVRWPNRLLTIIETDQIFIVVDIILFRIITAIADINYLLHVSSPILVLVLIWNIEYKCWYVRRCTNAKSKPSEAGSIWEGAATKWVRGDFYGKVAANDMTSAATWWRRGESNPRPKTLQQELLRAQTVLSIPATWREPSHFRDW